MKTIAFLVAALCNLYNRTLAGFLIDQPALMVVIAREETHLFDSR